MEVSPPLGEQHAIYRFVPNQTNQYPGPEVPKPYPGADSGAPNLKAIRRTSERRSVEPLAVFDNDLFQHLSNLIDIPIKFSRLRILTLTTLSQPSVKILLSLNQSCGESVLNCKRTVTTMD